jgi:hypothetical protein
VISTPLRAELPRHFRVMLQRMQLTVAGGDTLQV